MTDSIAALRRATEGAGSIAVLTGAGAKLAVVNPDPTPVDFMADWVLHAKSGELLPRLL